MGRIQKGKWQNSAYQEFPWNCCLGVPSRGGQLREGFFGIQGLPIWRILQRQPRPGRENADENQNEDEILGPHGTNCQMFAKTDHGEIKKCCAKKFTKNELPAITCTHFNKN